MRDSTGRTHAVLVVEQMPFFSLQEENLQTLTVLLGYYADGISRIAADSGTGAAVDAEALPIHPGARDWFSRSGDPVTSCLAGGDDYELAIAAPPAARSKLAAIAKQTKTKLTRIGSVAKGRGVTAVQADGAPLNIRHAGFTHW